ncbi:hypothetical protein [Streptomyces hygroscopicus]|uniref:hypothetical protein n=1 Tax=Streptomyces hygroscopicus TaxID=1912 RepID=UPI003687CF50
MARTISHPRTLPHTEYRADDGSGQRRQRQRPRQRNGNGDGDGDGDGSAHPGGVQQPVSAGRTATAPAGCVDHRTAAYVILVKAPLITTDHR